MCRSQANANAHIIRRDADSTDHSRTCLHCGGIAHWRLGQSRLRHHPHIRLRSRHSPRILPSSSVMPRSFDSQMPRSAAAGDSIIQTVTDVTLCFADFGKARIHRCDITLLVVVFAPRAFEVAVAPIHWAEHGRSKPITDKVVFVSNVTKKGRWSRSRSLCQQPDNCSRLWQRRHQASYAKGAKVKVLFSHTLYLYHVEYEYSKAVPCYATGSLPRQFSVEKH